MPRANLQLQLEVGLLIKEGLTNKEIAEALNKSVASVTLIAQRHHGGNSNYLSRITKHAHLREDVFKFFKDNSFDDTKRFFKLTQSELKSLMTVGYRDARLKSLRKDKRRKDKWTKEEINFTLRSIGLLSRKEIAKRIKRGSERVIKEKLNHLGTRYPKYLNGLTKSKFIERFNCEPLVVINTKAGPGGGKHSSTYFKIVPWVWIEEAIKDKYIKPPKVLKDWVKAMADFQRSIHGKDVYGSLKTIVPLREWEIQA